MTTLTQSQVALLKAAAEGPDGAESTPERTNTAKALIRRGLLISLPRPDAPSRLILTDAGRSAVGTPAAAKAPPRPSRKKAAASGAPPAEALTLPKGKLGVLVGLLRRPEGATIDQLIKATGWQAHSVRGAIAGAVKKKLGLAVTSLKAEGGERVYRIVEGAGA